MQKKISRNTAIKISEYISCEEKRLSSLRSGKNLCFKAKEIYKKISRICSANSFQFPGEFDPSSGACAQNVYGDLVAFRTAILRDELRQIVNQSLKLHDRITIHRLLNETLIPLKIYLNVIKEENF